MSTGDPNEHDATEVSGLPSSATGAAAFAPGAQFGVYAIRGVPGAYRGDQ